MRIRALQLCVLSLRASLRSHAANLIRCALVLLLIAVLVVAHHSATAFAAPGLMLFEFLVWTNFVAISVLGVSTFSGIITEEKEQGTLGLLKIAGFPATSILFGKSMGLLLSGLLLIMVQLPFVMLSITLGGVTLDQLAKAYALLPAYAVFVYGLGLFWSVVCSGSTRAALACTTTLAVYLILPWWVTALAKLWPSLRPAGLVLQWLSPFEQLKSASQSLAISSGVLPAALVHVVLAALLVVLAWVLFELATRNERAAAPTRGSADWLPRFRRRSFGRTWSRPLLGNEFRLRGGVFNLLLRCVALAVLAALLRLDRPDRTWRSYGDVLGSVGMTLLLVEAAWVASRFLGREAKWRTASVLAVLPIGTSRLIWEKLLGHLLHLVPTLVLFAAGRAIASANDPYPGYSSDFFQVMTYLFGTICFALHAITYLSLHLRRGAFAAVICGYVAGTYLFVSLTPGGPDARFVLIGLTALFGSIALQRMIARKWEDVAAK